MGDSSHYSLNNCIILISFSVTLIQKSGLAQKGKKLSPDTTQEEMKVQKLMTGKTQSQKFIINKTDGDSFSKYKIQENKALSQNIKICKHQKTFLVLYDYKCFSDERLPDSKSRSERERKQIQVEVSRAQKWAEMINTENVKKYFGF